MEVVVLLLVVPPLYVLALFLKVHYGARGSLPAAETSCPRCGRTRRRMKRGLCKCSACGRRFHVGETGRFDRLGFLHSWGLVFFGVVLLSICIFLVSSGRLWRIPDVGDGKAMALLLLFYVVGLVGLGVGLIRRVRSEEF